MNARKRHVKTFTVSNWVCIWLQPWTCRRRQVAIQRFSLYLQTYWQIERLGSHSWLHLLPLRLLRSCPVLDFATWCTWCPKKRRGEERTSQRIPAATSPELLAQRVDLQVATRISVLSVQMFTWSFQAQQWPRDEIPCLRCNMHNAVLMSL